MAQHGAIKMTQHTPAPWMITMSGRTKDGGAHQHQIGTHEKTVAYAWLPITDDKDQKFHEHNANARLIAAAPEYHEAAVRMLNIHDEQARRSNHTRCGCDECNAFRPIVAKAGGK